MADYQQPSPRPNDLPSMHDLLVEDVKTRKEFGLRKYGTILQAFNGRNFALDAYQEIIDLAVYLRGIIYEKDHSSTIPWMLSPLDKWSIVGCNHYFVDNVRHLFIAMTRGDALIKAEGISEIHVFENLMEQARKYEPDRSKRERPGTVGSVDATSTREPTDLLRSGDRTSP